MIVLLASKYIMSEVLVTNCSGKKPSETIRCKLIHIRLVLSHALYGEAQHAYSFNIFVFEFA